MSKDFWVHFFHVIIVSGLFFYIGIVQDKIPKFMFQAIIGLGAFIILYHVYKSLYKKDAWVNYIHIFLVGPLLMYIGFYEDKTPRKAFEIILLLAFASLGYHSYYTLRENLIIFKPFIY